MVSRETLKIAFNVWPESDFLSPKHGRLLEDSSRDSMLFDFDCFDDTRMPTQTFL